MPPKKKAAAADSEVQAQVEVRSKVDMEWETQPVPSRPAPTGQDDFVTVIVTPKLTFQLFRRPEWKTVQDISQDELRRGFLSRFPPALWMSSEKFSFKPALPAAQITEDTTSLVFKIVSDEVSDERVLLGILRELEKSYEAIIRRAVNETRSEAIREQVVLQEQAEDARKELDKQVKELKKDNRSLRDQLQSIQKRLFLVEQEKDSLRREQQQLLERTTRLERTQLEQAREHKAELLEIREQIHGLSLSERERPKEKSKERLKPDAGGLPGSHKVHAGSQTERPGPEAGEVLEVSHRVDGLQEQLQALQSWLSLAPRAKG